MKVIQLTPQDNVAVLVEPGKKGDTVDNIPNLTLREDIPQSHKITLEDVKKGEPIRRYGVVLGYALKDFPKGSWINETSLKLPKSPALEALHANPDFKEPDNIRPVKQNYFMGYANDPEFSPYAGTRNILAIHTTVQCVIGIVNAAIAYIKQNILPKYPHVDDVIAINHQYGCGVAINAENAAIPINALRSLLHHPNFGGQIMCVSLGCEKLTPQMLLQDECKPENLVILQAQHGFKGMLHAIIEMAETKLKKLDERRRTKQPLSKLLIGLQCGGSDAFSGVSGNTSVGYAADMLVKAGATVMFSEVSEVRDGVQFIANRITSPATCEKFKQQVGWYDKYLAAGGVDRSANPSPGNKKGGLSTIVEKSMGSIAKSGSLEIKEVLTPGERPHKHGMIFAATPASDLVCGTMQMCSGATLQVFVTGRGTPYGLAALPVLKVCTRNELKQRWNDVIDINTGSVLTDDTSIEDMGESVCNTILRVADGDQQPFTEQYGIYNDICLFNPTPNT
ncbi:UxaA family hydrolase [Lacticaseibacillus paracasei]|uniref:UxaA family hydrolase n=1 Tax=Lacticaseibacillus paracasei TaxID=1597 RepID=UPI001BA94ADC|nr:UxaA family hydrolase [Lacticaseibacillus paracasei]MBS0992852.1 UxaA family hydrolase [Lacticaseibacillus paracasei]